MTTTAVSVGGPWFEDFKVGQVFADAPALTLTDGLATLHQSLSGDRLRLPLDHELSREMTGSSQPVAHPTLVCHIAVGQTTGASQRVKGNLFYRGLEMLQPVHLGDTLTTVAEVVALRQNRPKPGRPATGLVVLRVQVANQHDTPVLDYWRCPMIPLRDPAGDTGHADSFDEITADVDAATLASRVDGWGWRLAAFRDRTGSEWPHFAEVDPGTHFVVDGRDTVTGATELARATLNIASAHTDPAAGPSGRRLVYGGHTISLAGAATTRALPNLVTILAWRSCDHTGPVFEGDVVRTEVTVDAVHPMTAGGLVELHAVVWADHGDGEPEQPVLDWHFVGLMA